MNKLSSILIVIVFFTLFGCTTNTIIDTQRTTNQQTTTHSSQSTNSSSTETTTSTTAVTTVTTTAATTTTVATTTAETTIPLSPLELYYQDAFEKTGDALKTALHNIIDDHREISYSQVWEALKETDEDPNNPNNVILLYSGISRSKTLNGGDSGDWNREHVWPQSHGDFGTAIGEGTDLHHLRPSDVTVNSIRGNKNFDYGGTAKSNCTVLVCLTDGDSFEPDDQVKGDVARMIFYMAVRYEGDLSDELNLELNDQLNGSQTGKTAYIGKISVLLEWHQLDPVDDFERRRNEIIYDDYQHNRNPFIDYPEFASLIWS